MKIIYWGIHFLDNKYPLIRTNSNPFVCWLSFLFLLMKILSFFLQPYYSSAPQTFSFILRIVFLFTVLIFLLLLLLKRWPRGEKERGFQKQNDNGLDFVKQNDKISI